MVSSGPFFPNFLLGMGMFNLVHLNDGGRWSLAAAFFLFWGAGFAPRTIGAVPFAQQADPPLDGVYTE
jgi:hypothetical protein